MARVELDPMLGDFRRNMAYIGAMIVVVVAALDTPGVQTAPLLAVIGTAGLVLGLTLKDCRTSPRT